MINKIRIVTAQFPVSANISKNLKYMIQLMERANRMTADVVHFSETCLGGYAGSEFKTWTGYEWKTLKKAEQTLQQLAKDLKLNIIYGTNHRVTDDDIRNRLIYVSDKGKCLAYYDKRFCTPGDLAFYKSGKRFVTFTIKGFKCGLFICYDLRFPELYREYKKRGVQIVFQSFYNAREKGPTVQTKIMRQTMQSHAATNYFYVSANNSSCYYQSWSSLFILPDGTIAKSCRRHRTDLILNEISSKDKYYDASGPFRDRAMSGILYSE